MATGVPLPLDHETVVVRNLLLGCRTFTELRDGAPGISRSLLSERLRQLETVGVIQRRPHPSGRGWLYEPTQACRDLQAVCDAMNAWGSTGWSSAHNI